MRTADDLEWRDDDPPDFGPFRALPLALALSGGLWALLALGAWAAARALGGA